MFLKSQRLCKKICMKHLFSGQSLNNDSAIKSQNNDLLSNPIRIAIVKYFINSNYKTGFQTMKRDIAFITNNRVYSLISDR